MVVPVISISELLLQMAWHFKNVKSWCKYISLNLVSSWTSWSSILSCAFKIFIWKVLYPDLNLFSNQGRRNYLIFRFISLHIHVCHSSQYFRIFPLLCISLISSLTACLIFSQSLVGGKVCKVVPCDSNLSLSETRSEFLHKWPWPFLKGISLCHLVEHYELEHEHC